MRITLRRTMTAVLGSTALAVLGLIGTTPGASAQSPPTAPATTTAATAADHAGGGGHGRSCRNGYVGLTFDDGPSATTPQLLAALRENHLRATMFNQGNNALARPDYVRAEVRARMWIGNHTFTHPHLPQLGEPGTFMEISSTQWVLRDLIGREPTLFRPPYGETNAQVRADLQRIGLLEVLWTVDSRDWAGATAEQIAAAAHTLQPGGIILMHDWPPATIQAIPLIARDLAARGLCAGRIVYTPRDIPFGSTVFHAIAVKS
jgi:peptidoglycan/xylan/chitin deacetylase (PgdA/CDA1 family)